MWTRFFLSVLLSLSSLPASAGAPTETLPKNIQTYLSERYPMDPVDRWVSSDLNGDHQADYALILKPDDCDPSFYCTTLLVALSSGTTHIAYRMMPVPNARYCDPLDIRPPGIYKGTEEISLKNTAIGCGKDTSYSLIWWDGQEFHQDWLR